MSKETWKWKCCHCRKIHSKVLDDGEIVDLDVCEKTLPILTQREREFIESKKKQKEEKKTKYKCVNPMCAYVCTQDELEKGYLCPKCGRDTFIVRKKK